MTALNEEVRTVATTSERVPLLTRLGRDSAYTLMSLPLALPAFVLVVVLVAVGGGVAVLGVGLPLLALGLVLARGFARLERGRLARLDAEPVAEPEYLTAAPDDGLFARLTAAARDRQSWLDVAWVVVSILTATVSWTLAATWWAAALGGTTYGLWGRTIPRGTDPVTLASLIGFGDSWAADVAVITTLGVIALVTLPWVLRVTTVLHSSLARDLLCGRAELQERVRRSEAGRRAGRAAEAESLRRLERNIHDGPQQRLVRLSMDLGRARTQLDQDPERVRETLEGALAQARETVDELRSLSRGIAPPVLVDRGLEAALREVVARSVVPATLTYDAPARLPDHVETALYFTASEALTNVAKHSGATHAGVALSVRGDGAELVIEDDGRGGATAVAGGGLAGLAQRAAAVDGVLSISSPGGGPTRVSVELPCG